MSTINQLCYYSLLKRICPDFPPASNGHPAVLFFLPSDIVQGCPEFVIALCLRSCYTTDPHAAFCRSMSEGNIWRPCRHSSFLSSSHRLFILLSNTTAVSFCSSDNLRFSAPEALTHLKPEKEMPSLTTHL